MWDYQTKACVHTLEGHAHNISAVAFHPELPIILTASEDGCIKMWHATTYRCGAAALVVLLILHPLTCRRWLACACAA